MSADRDPSSLCFVHITVMLIGDVRCSPIADATARLARTTSAPDPEMTSTASLMTRDSPPPPPRHKQTDITPNITTTKITRILQKQCNEPAGGHISLSNDICSAALLTLISSALLNRCMQLLITIAIIIGPFYGRIAVRPSVRPSVCSVEACNSRT